MVWVIAFGELFFGDLWCVVWGYGGMRTHFSLLNPFFKLSIVPIAPGTHHLNVLSVMGSRLNDCHHRSVARRPFGFRERQRRHPQ